ncbi:hypothetical protein CHU92_15025 [Flavobacterium cyanobacteriorum]|uniref:Lipoprotein n=1 Tax=Flavobacterium cyanobacteriorum TaxID=2022802 RepID=A0A255YTG2_9FLAO|nr:hypothetical protein [Flavobacterium cyanobacteriorum]OYQ31954.1 hypothetical protein CHU92_15025 [Flavobacterium cyanobacteriorum]
MVKKIILFLIISSFSSCETVKRTYFGMEKTEITIKPDTEVIEYYRPFLKDNEYALKIYTLSNYDAAGKALSNIGVPKIFIKNRKTNVIYQLDCFEDIQDNIQDINNNVIDGYITLKNEQEFKNLEAFINAAQSSKMIFFSGENNTMKTWDIYISYATFLGKKLRKLTLPVTELNDINEIIILNLSFNKSAAEIN